MGKERNSKPVKLVPMLVETREDKFEYHVKSHQKSRDNLESCVFFYAYTCQHAGGIRAEFENKLWNPAGIMAVWIKCLIVRFSCKISKQHLSEGINNMLTLQWAHKKNTQKPKAREKWGKYRRVQMGRADAVVLAPDSGRHVPPWR